MPCQRATRHGIPEHIGVACPLFAVTARERFRPGRIAGGFVYVPSRDLALRSRRSNQFTPVNAILNGALQSLADIVLQPIIFLAGIAHLLGGSSYQIAGFTVAALASWALAGLIVWPLRLLRRGDYQSMIGGAVARMLAAIVLGVIGYRLPDGAAGGQVAALLIAYAVYQLAAAVVGRASVRAIQSAAAKASRKGLFRDRAITGAVMAVIGGLVVWSACRSMGTTGENSGILLVLAAIATAAATWFLFAIPAHHPSPAHSPSTSHLAAPVLTPLRSQAYRRFLIYRLFLAFCAAADPFLIVFGLVRLGLNLGDIGLSVAVYATGHLAGILVWSRWVAMWSARAPLQIISLLRLLILVIAVSIPSISTSGLYAGRFDGPQVAVWCFIAIFGLLGLVVSANNVSNFPYLLDIVPAGQARPAIALSNAVMGVMALAPLAAAYLVERFSLESMLYSAIALALIALVSSGLLVESRVRVRQRFGLRSVRRMMSRYAT